MPRLTWNSLESIRLWGAPTEIDGIHLTVLQGKSLMGAVENLMNDAGYDKEESIKRGVDWFRSMFEVIDGEWAARPEVEVHGGVRVRNKYFKADQKGRLVSKLKRRMAEERRLQARCLKVVHKLLSEAGKRNSKVDGGRISTALSGLFDVLNKRDQEEIVKALGKKMGRSFRFKQPEATR